MSHVYVTFEIFPLTIQVLVERVQMSQVLSAAEARAEVAEQKLQVLSAAEARAKAAEQKLQIAQQKLAELSQTTTVRIASRLL